MKVSEYSTMDAVELSGLIRSGKVSAMEVQEAAKLAVAEAGGRLNAIVGAPFKNPLKYDPGGWFSGVPFAVKDLGCSIAGIPSRAGSFMTGDGFVSADDCDLMARFRTAGLSGIALATTDELGFGANTNTPRFGRTLNPYDIALSPGGSSGGSAALVAAGAVPIAHASDAGGSIRIPASVTGLVGLKPSRGRIPAGPASQEGHWGLASSFAVTRSVRDSAMLLDLIAGGAPGDRTVLPSPLRPWSKELLPQQRRLRIGLIVEEWGESPVEPDVRVAVEAAGEALAGIGHFVEFADFRFDWDAMLEAVQILGCASTAISVSELETRTGLNAEQGRLQPIILSYRDFGLRLGAVDIGRALRTMNDVSRAFGAIFQKYDAILLPNMTTVAWKGDDFNPSNPVVDAWEWMRKMFSVFCYNPVFNLTGTPVISLPTGWTAKGFPIGVQLATDMCDEATLFALSADLERALPWAHRRPPGHVSKVQ